MAAVINKDFKVLYARLIKLDLTGYLLSKDFETFLIEHDADVFWKRTCWQLVGSGPIVRRNQAEDNLGVFIDLGMRRVGPERFGEILVAMLVDYESWRAREPRGLLRRERAQYEAVADALSAAPGGEDVDVSLLRSLGSDPAPIVFDPPKVDAPAPSPVTLPKRTRPRLFIGSSVEGKKYADAIQVNLDHDAEVTIWSQGVFGLSGGTLETLANKAGEFDFAVLVLTPDDLVEIREQKHNSPRDNVLLELGLFVGALGRERTFVVHPRDVPLHLPSDLAGVTPATFVSKREDGNITAALGSASTQIKDAMKTAGVRD